MPFDEDPKQRFLNGRGWLSCVSSDSLLFNRGICTFGVVGLPETMRTSFLGEEEMCFGFSFFEFASLFLLEIFPTFFLTATSMVQRCCQRRIRAMSTAFWRCISSACACQCIARPWASAQASNSCRAIMYQASHCRTRSNKSLLTWFKRAFSR